MYQKTRDLVVVRDWIEKHQAEPAIIKDTDILKIKFAGECKYCENCDNCDDSLEAISWESFCEIFRQLNLFFLYDKQPDSEFYKIILDPHFDSQDFP